MITDITAVTIKPYIGQRVLVESNSGIKSFHTILEYIRGNIITDSDALHKKNIRSISLVNKTEESI